MIKRFRFTAPAPPGAGDRAGHDVRTTLEAGLAARDGVRPLRVALCTALLDVVPGQRHEAVGIEWFTDADHARRYDEWSASPGVGGPPDPSGRDDGLVVAADEVVLRGRDWIERRWRDGGEALKHMAIARRAEGLTPDAFKELWRSRAGTVRSPGGAAAVTIPDEARGCAYIQNNPLARAAGEWAYDAVNEVYFDALDGLRRRIAWFDDALGGGTEDDLVSRHWFLAVREVVLATG